MSAKAPSPSDPCPFWEDGQHCYSDTEWDFDNQIMHDRRECRCGAKVAAKRTEAG